MNKRGYSVFCLTALLVLGANLARAQDLTPVETDTVGTNPISMATGDFNNDGFTDIVVANGNGASVSVLLNLGNAKFNAAVPYTVGKTPHAVAVGDFDEDGYPDVATANSSDGTVSILLNNEDGTFGAKTDVPAGVSPYSIAVTDFDGDGHMDIVVTVQGQVNVLLGNGDGTFQAPVSTPVGINPVSVAVGNFYTTGFKRDLAVADMSGAVYVLKYKAAGPPGHFQAPTPIAIPGTFPRPFAIITVDLGNGGRSDLIVTDYSSQVFVALATGPGTFSAPVAYPVGFVPTSVAVGDFNGDTKNDLLVANSYSGTVTIYHGTTPAGTFDLSSRQDISTGMLSDYVVAGDFKKANSTLRPDAAVAVYFNNAVTILTGIRPAPTPALVGHTISAPCNAPATMCSVTYNATAGNTLVVSCPGWSQVGSVNAASVTDTLGAVFTKDGQKTATVVGDKSFTSLFHSFGVVTSGSRTITCNMSGSYWGVVIVAEFSVVTAVDGPFISNRGNSTTANSTNLATLHAVDVLVGTVSSDIVSGSCTFTPTGGWATVDAFLNSNSTVCAGMVYKIVSATANYKTTVTVDSAPWAAAIRAYQ